MWNLVSDLKAVNENSVQFSSSMIWLFDALKKNKENSPKKAFEQRNKQAQI